MKTLRFKQLLSLLSLLAAIGFGAAGFAVPPTGEISDTVLWLIAQMLTASGTYIGLDVYFERFRNLTKRNGNEHPNSCD